LEAPPCALCSRVRHAPQRPQGIHLMVREPCPAGATRIWRRSRTILQRPPMTRIDARFAALRTQDVPRRPHHFVMAGDPYPPRPAPILKALPAAGADVIEVGSAIHRPDGGRARYPGGGPAGTPSRPELWLKTVESGARTFVFTRRDACRADGTTYNSDLHLWVKPVLHCRRQGAGGRCPHRGGFAARGRYRGFAFRHYGLD